MREQIRLVDEPTPQLTRDANCTLCGNGVGPFLELPLPAHLIGTSDVDSVGAFELCPDCFEAACQVGGVVSKERFDVIVEQAQTAEAAVQRLGAAEKKYLAETGRLEKQLVDAEALATTAEGRRAAAERRVEELLADPVIAQRERLRDRLDAIASKPSGRKKAAA